MKFISIHIKQNKRLTMLSVFCRVLAWFWSGFGRFKSGFCRVSVRLLLGFGRQFVGFCQMILSGLDLVLNFDQVLVGFKSGSVGFRSGFCRILVRFCRALVRFLSSFWLIKVRIWLIWTGNSGLLCVRIPYVDKYYEKPQTGRTPTQLKKHT